EWTVAAAAAAAARFAVVAHHHAAVQLHAQLIGTRRIVGRRHVDIVEEVAGRGAPEEAHLPSLGGYGIDATDLQSRQRLVEGDAGVDDRLDGLRGVIRRARVEESLEGLIGGRWRSGSGRRTKDTKAAEDTKGGQGKLFSASAFGHVYMLALNARSSRNDSSALPFLSGAV